MRRARKARGLSLCPSGAPELHLNHATALISLARAEEAVRLLRAASDAFPDHIQLAALLASALNAVADAKPEEVFAAHRRVGDAIEKAHGPVPLRRPMTDQVRIGLLSPDLRTHSVSYFVEPLLRHIDRAICEIVCFSTSVHEDATSERLAALASGWRNLALHSDDDAAAGFGQWAAADEDSFARIASELAENRGRLSELRSRLRVSIAISSLCDGAGYARRLAAMIRSIAQTASSLPPT